MEQEIIGGKVYFFDTLGAFDGYLGDLERMKRPKAREVKEKVLQREAQREQNIEFLMKKYRLTRPEAFAVVELRQKHFLPTIVAVERVKSQRKQQLGDFGYLNNLEASWKKFKRSIKKTIKKPARLITAPARAVGIKSKKLEKIEKAIGKVGKPLAIGTGVFFGTPLLATKVVPALAGTGKTLLDKIGKTKSGAWWAKQGKKIYRVVKTPKKKVISQEINEDNPMYEELMAKLTDGVYTNSAIRPKLSEPIPFPLPSGLDKEDVEKVVSNMPESEPLPDVYEPDKQIEITGKGEVKRTQPVKTETLLPIMAGTGALLFLS